VVQARFSRKRREGAVYDLIDRIDGFPLARTAAKNKNAGNQVKVHVVGIVMALAFAVFPKDDAGNFDGFTAVTTKDSPKLFSG
jgi:hypothetical protein